ncbi:uncharacterized protein LODBEIA_P29170 [Lodderomyces beijingensis]|uniref:Anaphase-promoting complex subunit 1 beta-sandwich domain-containing protein n=1 Tax=Lodderomyces beijingensis TaxID=1775926 RepID=A0ABP0ZKL4_9ASCO
MSLENLDQLRTPTLELTEGYKFPKTQGEIVLCSKRILLLVEKQQVSIYNGFLINRVLKYDEEIVKACITTFVIKESPTQILAVCFRKHINFYYPNWKLYTLHLPFEIVSVKEYEKGLVLQTRMELYLVNKDFDLKFVDKDTNSAFSSHEIVCTYRQRDKGVSLCTTVLDGMVNVYHVKNSSRSMNFNSKAFAKSSKKKHYSMSTIPSIGKHSEPNLSQFIISEHRTSTLLSEARVSNQSSASVANLLQKDVILSKIESIGSGSKLSRTHFRIFDISFEDQEGIVIVNKLKQELHVYRYNSYSKYQSVYKCPCLDSIPLGSRKDEGHLVVLTDEGLLILNPFLEIRAGCSVGKPVSELISSCDDNLAFRSNDDSVNIVKLILEPATLLVSSCLKCFKFLSGSTVNQTIWILWRAAFSFNGDEWDSLVISLLSLFFPFDDGAPGVENCVTDLLPQAKHLRESSHLNYSLTDLIPYITLSLHLIREDFRLDVTRKRDLSILGTFLTQVCAWMGWTEDWLKYYSSGINVDMTTRILSLQVLKTPPNLFESLASLFTNTIVPYVSFSQLVEESESVDAVITPLTHIVLKLFEVLVSPHYGASNLVDMMGDLGITSLDTLPLGVSLPLKEALSVSQESPSFDWSFNSLALTGREDLRRLLTNEMSSDIKSKTHPLHHHHHHHDVHVHHRHHHHHHHHPQDIESITTNVAPTDVNSWDDQAEANRLEITKLIFDRDRRYLEITTLLHQTKTQTAYLKVEENIAEYDLVLLQRSLAVVVALRTLTIPMGRAALYYGGRKPILTERFPIPKFNLNTLISPTMTNIIHSEDSVAKDLIEWGHFHNGVSSGLSISPESKGISGSWIIFNKPQELNAQHAGFLLGLGLNGHLSKLEEWHIYNYLGPKHPLTSIGLLIGMAASLRRTMDNKLTKVLSVHAVALLPRGANDLNVPTSVQTAGLMGIGLLYLETQHRRMSEILLSQTTGTVQQNNSVHVNEGYRLASGIALGYVNLGKGDDLRGLNDTHVVDKLMTLVISMKDTGSSQELGKSSCGAIMALCLIYLKTENASIANKLRIPDSEQLLDYIRPDLLFLRCLAVNMIMWSQIDASRAWVESQIPQTVVAEFKRVQGFNSMDSDLLIYLNILGGLSLSIAMKYASTHNTEARDTVLYYLDELMELTRKPAVNYDQKLTYNTALSMQNILALCASVIMAASGDLEVFRRLRVLHNDTTKKLGYGGYMAINSALGFLFLGGGQMAFDNVSLFGVASLITSLYPIYPRENSEYEIHLQALRHFWALAIVPRCVIVRDVKTNEPCKIPITIKMKNGESLDRLSPCLIPDPNEIQQLETKSINYFDVVIDFELRSELLENFEKSLTLYVSKKQNYSLLKPTVRSILQSKSKSKNQNIAKESLLNCEIMADLSHASKLAWQNETDLRLSNFKNNELSVYSIMNARLELINYVKVANSTEDIWNLKLIFEYARKMERDDLNFVSLDFINELKHNLWVKVKSLSEA